MKKTVCVILAVMLALAALCGCSSSARSSYPEVVIIDPESVSEEAAPEASAEEMPAPTETPTPEPTPEPTETPTPEPTPEPEPVPEGYVKSILTGEYVPEEIGNRRPVAFMIDNVWGAFPHYGLSLASVVFEAPVEAELCRECAVFENYDDISRLGSLRSSRDYFISYASGLDSIYCHYGQAAYALPYLESDDVDNISGLMGYGGYYFFREYDIAAPHNAYTSGAQINEAISDLGYRQNHTEGFQGSFRFVKPDESADLTGAADAHFVQTGYMVSDSYFVYDEGTGLYMRYQYDEPEKDGLTGEQLSCRNIIFEYQNASTYDVSVYVHFETTGSGYGKYFTEGKAIDIRWERDSFYSPARYYRMDDGSELKMNCGKTWVSIIKNKHVGLAMYGPSYSEAVCVVDANLQAQLEEENAVWEANFKANEEAYRAELDRQHAEALASHGGISKVE